MALILPNVHGEVTSSRTLQEFHGMAKNGHLPGSKVRALESLSDDTTTKLAEVCFGSSRIAARGCKGFGQVADAPSVRDLRSMRDIVKNANLSVKHHRE